MNILLTIKQLNHLGGSQTWLYTMYETLTEMGHEVDVYSHEPNTLWPKMKIWNRHKKYDVAICSHAVSMKPHVLKNCNLIIHTRHGVIPVAENPPPHADIYVSVSEETGEATLKDYGLAINKESAIIRNPIDTDLFSPEPTRLPNPQIGKVLVVSNNPSQGIPDLFKKVLPHAKVSGIGKNYEVVIRTQEGMRSQYLWADLVVTLGRGCYEALACGVPVLPIDVRGGDKIVTPENIDFLRRNNCSGRALGIEYDEESLAAELENYDPFEDATTALRKVIVEEQDRFVVAKQYLDLI